MGYAHPILSRDTVHFPRRVPTPAIGVGSGHHTDIDEVTLLIDSVPLCVLQTAKSEVQFRAIAVSALVEVVRVGGKPAHAGIDWFEAAVTLVQRARPVHVVLDGRRDTVARVLAKSVKNAPQVIEVVQPLALKRAETEGDAVGVRAVGLSGHTTTMV